jgi:hypothetical protein
MTLWEVIKPVTLIEKPQKESNQRNNNPGSGSVVVECLALGQNRLRLWIHNFDAIAIGKCCPD